jgi:EAL domain-containing protein (putative c-di-GMP-specific phosphodiesterase class I)
METRSEARAVVRSLVTLAQNLDLQVVVEGIETPQQLDAIKRLGGDAVQGFLLGKPTPQPEAYFSRKTEPFLETPDADQASERSLTCS